MTEVLGGVLMMVGGGMLSVPLVELLRSERPSVSAGVREALRHAPPPPDTPQDMLRMIDRLS